MRKAAQPSFRLAAAGVSYPLSANVVVDVWTRSRRSLSHGGSEFVDVLPFLISATEATAVHNRLGHNARSLRQIVALPSSPGAEWTRVTPPGPPTRLPQGHVRR